MPAKSDSDEDAVEKYVGSSQRLTSAWTLWATRSAGHLPSLKTLPRSSNTTPKTNTTPKACYPRLNSGADLTMADTKGHENGTAFTAMRATSAGSQQEATLFAVRSQLTSATTSFSSLLVTVLISIAYMGASAIAILINKNILVNLHFLYPVTITWLGLLVTTVASAIVVHVWLPTSSRRGVSLRYYMTHIMPCGFFMAVAFLTGNMSFMYLTLAFVQMLKASTPVVTMCLLFVFQLEKASSRLIVSVCVICVGVCVAGYGELNVSFIGVASMLTSVFAEAMRLVITQFLMDPKGLELHPMEGLMYISSACCMWLLAQAMLGEWTRLIQNKAYLAMMNNPIPFVTSAMAGFGVNVLAILVIKRASSLTLKVLGTVKDAALVVISVAFLKETVGPLQLVGYVVSLGGFVAYNVAKAKASNAPVQAGTVSPSSVVKLA